MSNFYFGGREQRKFRTSKNLEELPCLQGHLLQEPCSIAILQLTAGQVFGQILALAVFYPGHPKNRETQHKSEAGVGVYRGSAEKDCRVCWLQSVDAVGEYQTGRVCLTGDVGVGAARMLGVSMAPYYSASLYV